MVVDRSALADQLARMFVADLAGEPRRLLTGEVFKLGLDGKPAKDQSFKIGEKGQETSRSVRPGTRCSFR
jgi:hypothetical protein